MDTLPETFSHLGLPIAVTQDFPAHCLSLGVGWPSLLMYMYCSYFSFLLIVKYLILLTLNILASTVIASLTWAAFLYITTVLSLASFAQILLPAVPLVPVPGCSDGEMYSSPCLGLRCQHFVVGSRT